MHPMGVKLELDDLEELTVQALDERNEVEIRVGHELLGVTTAFEANLGEVGLKLI